MSFQGTSLSKRLPTVTSRVNTAHGKSVRRTWILNSSNQSSTNVVTTDQDHSAYIYSGSHSYTPTSSKRSGILRTKTKDIRSFLQQMERYLTNSQTGLWNVEWTESFGAGAGITLQITPLKSFDVLASSVSSLKKPRKKNLKNGQVSYALK